MKIILLEDVKKVGVRGALVTVADGYAQNVLIPKKQALPATPQNVQRWEREQKEREQQKEMGSEMAAKLASGIDGKTIELSARANPSGGLFEAIHEKQIAEAIQKQLSVSIAESAIDLSAPIKKLGEHRVKIVLNEKKADLTINVQSL